MDMDLSERFALHGAEVDAHDEMTVGGKRVVLALLLAGQVPPGVEPMRIARGQEQSFGAVSLGQFSRRFAASGMDAGRHGAKGVALSRPAGNGSGGLIPFEQNRGHGQGRFARGSFAFGFGRGGGFAGRSGGFVRSAGGGFGGASFAGGSGRVLNNLFEG